MQKVLFVSKPIEPPFHDGSKCLVRDVATHLETFDPIVMTSKAAAATLSQSLGAPRVEALSVYSRPGSFAPSLLENLRAFGALAWHQRADVWHFVFAPNPRTSRAIGSLLTLRGVPSVQTIASAPRVFADVRSLLFGGIVVAQSNWTKARIADACRAEDFACDLRLVPPPAPTKVSAEAHEIESVRTRLGLEGEGPIFVYPGDLEVGSGARVFARLIAPLSERVPDARFVFACRPKTKHAAEIQRGLEAGLDPARVRFAGELPNLPALLGLATAVLFPVDDLWGKVDIPIVLLEAMALGVPIVSLDQGPLQDLGGVVKVADLDVGGWVEASLSLLAPGRAAEIAAAQRGYLERTHSARVVAAAYEAVYRDLLRPTDSERRSSRPSSIPAATRG